MQTDFENFTMGTGWASINGNPTFQNNICGPVPSPVHIWMGDTATSIRSLKTVGLDLSQPVITVEFWMRYGRDLNSGPCEAPDLNTEGVHLQYSVNNGGSWSDFLGPNLKPTGTNSINGPFTDVSLSKGTGGYWTPEQDSASQSTSSLYYWHKYLCYFPVHASTSSTKIRWAQLSHNGSGHDIWGLDDIRIIQNNIPYDSITWKDETGNILSVQNNQINVVPNHSQYYYTYTTKTVIQLSYVDSIFIYVHPKSDLSLPNSDTICNNSSTTLNINPGFQSVLWSTGSTVDWASISNPPFPIGSNLITVQGMDSNSCMTFDTCEVVILDCTSISDLNQEEKIEVFPNPSNGIFSVSIFEAEKGKHTIHVYNAEGKEVYHIKSQFIIQSSRRNSISRTFRVVLI